MNTPSRTEALFTATLSAALLALGVTAFATAGRTAAEPALHVTLPAVQIVGKRAAPTAERLLPVADAARVDGTVARSAS